MSDAARIGIIADWGTGTGEAINLLQEITAYKPEILMHLGDIYYSGTKDEVKKHFRKPWERFLKDKIQTYTLSGNHDMYSGGDPYYKMIRKLGQPASYFCLQNDYWQILSIDTGRNSLFNPISPGIGDHELEWIKDKINGRGHRKTILLSHHQLLSADHKFEDRKNYNERLYEQFKEVLSEIDLWLWGHEHNLVVFKNDLELGPGIKLKRGRCVGGSAFPVGEDEIDFSKRNFEMVQPVSLDLEQSQKYFYQHCYAIIDLNKGNAVVKYYEDQRPNAPLFTEEIFD